MPVKRTLEPELLDSLPPGHPDALHNRRDLRLTNTLLGNHRWFARMLPPLVRPGEVALELGAGTGELAARLAARAVAVDGLDVWPAPPRWPEERTWHVSDLRTFGGYEPYPVVLGNLIFHQFSDAELRCLGAKLQPAARVIVASEPSRRRMSQLLYHVFGRLLGANHVSLHDAHVSIAAGFRNRELPQALGLGSEWHIRCATTVLGMYRMVAVRRPVRAGEPPPPPHAARPPRNQTGNRSA
jgi:hypothetical protein